MCNGKDVEGALLKKVQVSGSLTNSLRNESYVIKNS